jgi:hypothetical protein
MPLKGIACPCDIARSSKTFWEATHFTYDQLYIHFFLFSDAQDAIANGVFREVRIAFDRPHGDLYRAGRNMGVMAGELPT